MDNKDYPSWLYEDSEPVTDLGSTDMFETELSPAPEPIGSDYPDWLYEEPPPQPEAQPQDEGASILDNAWATWGYASGELSEGIGMLMDEWLGWESGAEFARNVGASAKAYHEKSIDPEEWERIRAKAGEQFATLKDDGDWYNPSDWERGEADLESLFYMALGSAPATVATFPVAGLGGKAAMKAVEGLKGVKKLKNASKVGRIAEAAGGNAKAIAAGKRADKILDRIQKVAVGTAYGAAEGAISAGMTGEAVSEHFDTAPIEDLLLDSPFVQKVYEAGIAEGMTQEEAAQNARETARDAAVSESMRKTFATTAAFGAPTGIVLSSALVRTPFAKPFAKGKIRGLAKGAAAEAVEEGIQSPFEQYWQNTALQKYADENIKLSEGVFEAAITGIVVGGAIGAPIGMAGTPTKAQAGKMDDKAKNSKDTLKIEVHARLAAASLMQNHGVTPEEATKLVTPILQAFANGDSSIIEAAMDLKHLEKHGRLRERGLDNVQTEEVPEAGDLDVNVEVEAGQKRGDRDEPLERAYGSFNGTIDLDGMNTDVIMGESGPRIYIVEQTNEDGTFRQHKVLYGFESEEEALNAFYSMYNKQGDGLYEKPTGYNSLGSITEVTHEELSFWLEDNTNFNRAEGLEAADEPLTETEDITQRSDEDLQAGIDDLQAQVDQFKDDGVGDIEPVKARLKTLQEEQKQRANIAAEAAQEELMPETDDEFVLKAREVMAGTKGVISNTTLAYESALRQKGLNDEADRFIGEAQRIETEALETRATESKAKLKKAKATAKKKAPRGTSDETPLSLREGGQTMQGPYGPVIRETTLENKKAAVEVDFLHLSTTPDLQTLSGKKAGTSGVSRVDRNVTGDRVYIYAQEQAGMGGRSVAGNEGAVSRTSKQVYSGTINGLYDIDTDPLGIHKGSKRITSAHEAAILKAGYVGWYWEKMPNVDGGMGAILDRDIAAMYHGKAGEVSRLLHEPSMHERLVTWETIAGKVSPLYEAARLLSPAELQKLNSAMLLGVVIKKDLRVDMLAAAMGVDSRLLIQRVGGYAGKVMPSMQVSLDSDLQADVYAYAIKLIYGQDAVPWMHAVKGGSKYAVLIQTKETPTTGQLKQFQANLESEIDGNAGFTIMPDGSIVVGNFTFGAMSNKKFDKAVIKASNALPHGTINDFNFEGEYRDESQAETRRLFERGVAALGSPDLQGWVDTAKARAIGNGRAFFAGLPESHPARQALDAVVTPFSVAAEPFQLEPDKYFTDEPFYSALLKTVEGAEGMPKKGAAQIKRWLEAKQKKGAFRLEEVEWMGLYEFLDNPTADAMYGILNMGGATEEQVTEYFRRKKDFGPVTRKDVQEFVRMHEVRIVEIPYGDKPVGNGLQEAYDKARNDLLEYSHKHGIPDDVTFHLGRRYITQTIARKFGSNSQLDQKMVDEYRDLHLAVEEAQREIMWSAPAVKYEEWTLGQGDGAENQRELLLTLPYLPEGWTGTHFSDTKGIMVHVRFNDRIDENGNRVLFIEEVQSDYHQTGRKKGYKPSNSLVLETMTKFESEYKQILAASAALDKKYPDTYAHDKAEFEIDFAAYMKLQEGFMERLAAASKKINFTTRIIINHDGKLHPVVNDMVVGMESGYDSMYDAVIAGISSSRSTLVPDAPFKKTWPMLAMKRMIRYAAENGYTSIGWTTGDQQNERYNLANYLSHITYDPIDEQLHAFDRDGEMAISESVGPDELGDYLPEELAQQIRDEMELGSNWYEISPIGEGEDTRYTLIDGNAESVWAGDGNPLEFTYREDAEQAVRDMMPDITIEDLDVKVGGEGMEGFYDESLVNNVTKFVKKWGGKVKAFGGAVEAAEREEIIEDEEGYMEITREKAEELLTAGHEVSGFHEEAGAGDNVNTVGEMDEYSYFWLEKYQAEMAGMNYRAGERNLQTVHKLDITPQMQEAAMEGFALFSLGQGATAAEMAQAKKHAKALYERTDWTQIDPDTDAQIAGALTPEEIQDAITEYALFGTMSKYFRKWFGKSKVTDSFGTPLTLFHGTPTGDIEKFDLKYTHRGFISLSTSADFANQFSGYIDPMGEDDASLANGYEWAPVQDSTMYPVYVKAEKLFDFRNKSMRRSYIRWYKDNVLFTEIQKKSPLMKLDAKHPQMKPYVEHMQAVSNRLKDGDWAYLENKRMKQFLQERGYDAFYMVEGGALNIGVFDPRNIKSATGNAGTFNPETRDTVFSLDPNQVGNELSRRLALFQLKAHLERTTTPESTPKAVQAHIKDGLERGLYDNRVFKGVKGKTRADILKRIEQSIRGGEPITNRTALSPDLVQQEWARMTQTWKLPPKFEALPDYRGLPDYIQGHVEAAGFQNRVEGTIDPFDDAKVYVVAGNIGDLQTLHRVFIEESLGHHGLRGFFGENLNSFLDDVIPNVEGSDAWNELIATYTNIAEKLRSKKPAVRRQGKRMATEELIAKQAVDQNVWDKFVAWFRAALREMGLITNYTENDIKRVMAMVHDRVINGTTPHPWGVRNHRPAAYGAVPFSLAYHGSGAAFDEVDLDYVGTGEGGAAYGHGFYVAEREGVARFYLPKGLMKDGKPFKEGVDSSSTFAQVALKKAGGDYELARKDVGSFLSNPLTKTDALDVLNQMEADGVTADMGNLYELDISNEAIETMIDWDAHMDDQPDAVKAAIEASPWVKKQLERWVNSFGTDRINGDKIYRAFSFEPSDGMTTNQKEASEKLKSLGVAGIKYKDYASRGFRGGLITQLVDAAKDTKNYVVFDKEHVNLISRNGVPFSIQTKGHMNGTGAGLRGHSVGDVYPLMVLGIGNPNSDLKWAVQRPDGTISKGRFDTPAEAQKYAKEISEGLNTVPFSVAKFPQYKEEYPPVAEQEAQVDTKTGKPFVGKGTSPMGEAFKAARAQIVKEMEESGFDPFFDPNERFDVDPSEYPPEIDTTKEGAAKQKLTKARINKRVKTVGARRRLQKAYDTGVEQGGNDMWYQMGQLEAEFIKEYGEQEGRRQFKERFIDAMASTTAGQAPQQNFLMAMFMNYLNNRGELDSGFGLPEPIGAPYLALNKRMYRQIVERGEGYKKTQPKSHDFAANFSGWDWMATIDSQMMEIITPRLKKAKKIRPNMKYAYQELVIEMAAKNGVSPREFQEVAWGGYKYTKSGYVGKPMIQIVNEAIERTSRLTGASPEEVVRKGIVRSEAPMFSISEDPERAAYYTPSRLENLMQEYGYANGRVVAAVISINPDDFINATTATESFREQVRSEVWPLDLRIMAAEQQTPFIDIARRGAGWEITGHEGRHRLQALANDGVESVPVVARWKEAAHDNPTIGLPNAGSLAGQRMWLQPTEENKFRLEFSDPIDISWDNIIALRSRYGDEGLSAEAIQPDVAFSIAPQYALRRPEGHEDELSIINSKIARAHSEMTVLDRVSYWLRDFRQSMAAGDFIWGLKQGTLDDAASVERWERELFGNVLDASISPYKAMHTTKNLPSVMAAISKVGIPALVEGVFKPVAGRKGFIEIFRPNYEHEDADLQTLWEGYAAARRSNELIQQKNPDGTKREKLFDQGEIDRLLALEAQYPHFADVFDDWQAFNGQLLDLATEMGVISEAERTAWEQNDYIPFYRAMEEIEGVDQRTGWGQIKAGVEGQKSGIRRLHGSEKMLGNITENMWFNTASLIDKIYKNRAMNLVVDMLEGVAMQEYDMPWQAIKLNNGQLASALRKAGLLTRETSAADTPLKQVEAMTPEQRMKWSTVFRRVKPTASNVVGVMREGKMKYYEIEDEMLLRTLQGLGAEGLAGLMKAMGMSKSLLTRMVTLDPAFMLANWTRDTLSAWVTSNANFMPVLDSVRAMGDVFGEKDSYMQMMMSGAGGGGFYDLTGGDVSKVLKEELSHGGRHWLHSAWIGYLKVGAASENSNRLAIANKIIANGGTVAEGMYQAQDIMNFTMSGDYAAIKFLIRTVPFLNARMQGIYRLYRGARDHPVGFLLKGSAIMMASLALLARNWDDDDYERLEPWQKDINWNWFVDGFHYAIPKPFEVGLLFATIPERLARLMLGRDDLEVSAEALARGLGETLAFNPVPQLFKPMIEEFANYNLFLGRDIVNMSMTGLEYNEQATPWTSQAAQKLGKAMPDWAGPMQSPLRIEHTVRAYTGTMGLYTMNALDWIIRQADSDLPVRPTRRWYEKPVLSRFIKGDAATARYNKYSEKLYEVIDESNKAQRTFNKMVSEGRVEEAKAKALERRPLVDTSGKAGKGSARSKLNQFKSKLQEINAKQRAIELSRTMTADEKREMRDKLQIMRHKVLASSELLMQRLEEIGDTPASP